MVGGGAVSSSSSSSSSNSSSSRRNLSYCYTALRGEGASGNGGLPVKHVGLVFRICFVACVWRRAPETNHWSIASLESCCLSCQRLAIYSEAPCRNTGVPGLLHRRAGRTAVGLLPAPLLCEQGIALTLRVNMGYIGSCRGYEGII